MHDVIGDEEDRDPGDGHGLLVHLTGSRRGAREPLPDHPVEIGTDSDATIHFSPAREREVRPHHAWLRPRGARVQIVAEEGELYVNDERVDELVLAPGDVIRIGPRGPALRYRTYAGSLPAYKSPLEALGDCLETARQSSATFSGRVLAFLRAMPGEFWSTMPRFRVSVVLALMLLAAGFGWLGQRSATLEARLEQRLAWVEERRNVGLAEERAADPRRLAELRSRLQAATERIDQLEDRLGASGRVIAQASSSVVFLQGAYRFRHPERGRLLRFEVDASGRVIERADGARKVRLGGLGPPVEFRYTGTGFLVGERGVLLTNRHVAMPWLEEKAAQRWLDEGFEAQRARFIGYFPKRRTPIDMRVVRVARESDLAVLEAAQTPEGVAPLSLAARAPRTGEEVILLGYPAGMEALWARMSPRARSEVRQTTGEEFWETARVLAEQGYVEPLATRGIIGQVSADSVVYDAGTAVGGSGGPLLTSDGRVVAVNRAMLPRFDGSNLGVPVAHARALLGWEE